MFEQLEQVRAWYLEVQRLLEDGSVYADPPRAAALGKEQKELQPVTEAYQGWLSAGQAERDAQELMRDPDPELRALAQVRRQQAAQVELQARLDALQATSASVARQYERGVQARRAAADWEQKLRVLLLPRDRDDDKSVIVEIRSGVGGQEAALFAGDLYRMYSMYAERRRFSVEVISRSEAELGGLKEISFEVRGAGAWSRFKFESGTHRVQRVPETESQGRIQTSAATVAVLPEAEEVEVDIDPADLQIDTFRSGGAGGQHVNKTESAIRITHLPTGVVVECQDERSQYKNKDRAMKLLRSRLYQRQKEAQEAQRAGLRRDQVGSGDRSGRIRTYNFPQGRLTDHRIGFTSYKLEQIMNGELDEVVDALAAADEAARLRGEGETEQR